MSDCSPAFHSTATARGLIPPVNTPMPLTMFAPAAGARITGLGRADALIARSLVEQIDLRERGMQADQHRVRFEPKRVAYDVMAARENKARDAYRLPAE